MIAQEVLRGLSHIVIGLRTLFGTFKDNVELVLRIVALQPIKFYEGSNIMLVMTDIQSAVATAGPKSAEGNPVGSFETPPVWESSNPSVVTLVPSPDGMTCAVRSPSPGPLGKSTITVKAMIGGVQKVGTAEVEIVASEAASIEISFGTPS